MKRYVSSAAKVSLFFCLWMACLAPEALLAQTASTPAPAADSLPPRVQTGAEVLLSQPGLLARLKGKRLALVANHTAQVNGRHLADLLLQKGFRIQRVFAPEHGFRGGAEAGATIRDGVDTQTGLPVVSLYGANKKPTAAQLADVDIVIFDIQDVGTRFYTYLSTLAYVQEACAEQGPEFWVLDRPNPNGSAVSGPVLDTTQHRSFVGLHPIPVLHGMTLGEYAQLLNGERWLAGGRQARLTVVRMNHWTHNTTWEQTRLPWIPPSPNLPTPESARLYPYLCWYEGTPVSVGRGTPTPFTIVGIPGGRVLPAMDSTFYLSFGEGFTGIGITFTPVSIPGKADNPPYRDKPLHGLSIVRDSTVSSEALWLSAVDLLYFLYKEEGSGSSFFLPFFDRLAGTSQLKRQVIAGEKPFRIVLSWTPAVDAFRRIRARYLLYPR